MWVRTGSIETGNVAYTSLETGMSIWMEPNVELTHPFDFDIVDGFVVKSKQPNKNWRVVFGRGFIFDRIIAKVELREDAEDVMRFIVGNKKVIDSETGPWQRLIDDRKSVEKAIKGG